MLGSLGTENNVRTHCVCSLGTGLPSSSASRHLAQILEKKVNTKLQFLFYIVYYSSYMVMVSSPRYFTLCPSQ